MPERFEATTTTYDGPAVVDRKASAVAVFVSEERRDEALANLRGDAEWATIYIWRPAYEGEL